MNFPVDYFFSDDHEWVKKSNSPSTTVGISDFAQSELGDIVYVEIEAMPGKKIKKGEVFGTIESVKTVSDIFSPIDCEIVEANSKLEDFPDLVNTDPYGLGWMIKVKPENPKDFDNLLNAYEYKSLIYGKEVFQKELIHILYLDESNKIHYIPALRGEDGQITIHNDNLKTIYLTSLISATNLVKEQIAEEFEYLINKPNLKEYEMQKFFEEHPEFLLGTDYESLHPQITLNSESEHELRPDFILKPLTGVSYSPKIVELKMPGQKIEKLLPRREGMYAKIYEAVAQLREYSRYFEEKANRENIRKKLGFTAYRPSLTLIIGNKIEIGDERLKSTIIDSIMPIQLTTYNDILLKYKTMIRKL